MWYEIVCYLMNRPYKSIKLQQRVVIVLNETSTLQHRRERERERCKHREPARSGEMCLHAAHEVSVVCGRIRTSLQTAGAHYQRSSLLLFLLIKADPH